MFVPKISTVYALTLVSSSVYQEITLPAPELSVIQVLVGVMVLL